MFRFVLFGLLIFSFSDVYADEKITDSDNEVIDCTEEDNCKEERDSFVDSYIYYQNIPSGYRRGEVLSDSIKNNMELRASKKVLKSMSDDVKHEMQDSIKKSMELLNGKDPDGVYYFPGQ